MLRGEEPFQKALVTFNLTKLVDLQAEQFNEFKVIMKEDNEFNGWPKYNRGPSRSGVKFP